VARSVEVPVEEVFVLVTAAAAAAAAAAAWEMMTVAAKKVVLFAKWLWRDFSARHQTYDSLRQHCCGRPIHSFERVENLPVLP
jgi:hypothetical protein